MKLNFKREYVITGIALVIIVIVLVIWWRKLFWASSILEPGTIPKRNIIEHDRTVPLDIFDKLRQIGNYYEVNFYKLNEDNIKSELTKYEDLYKSNPDKLNGIKQYFELVRLYLKFKKLNDLNGEYTKLRVTHNPKYMPKQFDRVMDIIISFRDQYYKALNEIDEDSKLGVKITTDYIKDHYIESALMPEDIFNTIFNSTNSFPEMHLKITQFYENELSKINSIYNIYLTYDELLNNFINTHPDKLGLKTFMDL